MHRNTAAGWAVLSDGGISSLEAQHYLLHRLNEEEVQVNNTDSLRTSPAPCRGECDLDTQTRDTVALA